MRTKNQRIYSDDPAVLRRIADDFDYIGRKYHLDTRGGVLVVYALQTKKKDKKRKKKATRNKRAESASRH